MLHQVLQSTHWPPVTRLCSFCGFHKMAQHFQPLRTTSLCLGNSVSVASSCCVLYSYYVEIQRRCMQATLHGAPNQKHRLQLLWKEVDMRGLCVVPARVMMEAQSILACPLGLVSCSGRRWSRSAETRFVAAAGEPGSGGTPSLQLYCQRFGTPQAALVGAQHSIAGVEPVQGPHVSQTTQKTMPWATG